MSLARIRKPTLIVLSLLLALAALSLAPQPAAPASGGNAIALKAPSFVQVANAQEGTGAQDALAAAPMGFPQDEAGISAYFKSASPITLADVRSVFRVIEVQTADYIIGSVPVPDYEERYDVHVYVHRDGWFLAYYLSTDPAGKIVDWRGYSTTRIPTVFERSLAVVSSAAGIPLPSLTYYDFRYPNATHMMIVAEDDSNGNEFQINLPGTYSFYSRSWAIGGRANCYYSYEYAYVNLDGSTIGKNADSGCGAYLTAYGTIQAARLLPDTTHTVVVGTTHGGSCTGGLVLIYRVP